MCVRLELLSARPRTEVIHITCNMCARDSPDMYALIPRASGIHIRQIPRAHVTTITCIMQIHVCIYMYTCMCMYVRYVCVCVYVCMYVCMCVRVYMHLYACFQQIHIPSVNRQLLLLSNWL